MIKKIKGNIKDFFLVAVILFVIIAFFSRFFFPEPSIFVTPDFGLSDIFHSNLPGKYILHKALSQGFLPLWEKNISSGFPIFAMGPGTFNLYNFFAYKLAPFWFSYNLTYIVFFFLCALGTYFYLRSQKIMPLVSLFGALVFAFSGPMVSQIPHLNLIQTASFLPIIFYLTYLLSKNPSRKIFLILVFFISQQLFSDFMQIFVITIFGAFLYHLFLVRANVKQIFLFILAILLSCLIFSVSFFPAHELIGFTVRQSGLPARESSYFSYPPAHFLTMLRPYALGDPSRGSYPPFTITDGSIFWENTGYIGVIALLFALGSPPLFKKEKTVRFYLFLAGVAAILMTGKYSPLYFVHSIPPFSFFRVPSRFILLFVWSLVVLSCFSLNNIISFIKGRLGSFKTVLITLFLICISLFDLIYFGINYNPVGSVKDWLKKPQTARFLENKNYRIYSIGTDLVWNKVYLKKGWRGTLESYNFFQNGLSPNLNILYDVKSFQIYPILKTRRHEAVEQIISKGIRSEKNQIFIDNTAVSAFRLYNVRYIVSPLKIASLPKVYATDSKNGVSFGIYEIPGTHDRAWFAASLKKISTVQDFEREIAKNGNLPGRQALIEEDRAFISTKISASTADKINWIKDSGSEIILKTDSQSDSFLVLADSYYPGWRVFIDGAPGKIYAVNINQKGVYLKSGAHEVKFVYMPESLRHGALLTGTGLLIIIFVILFPRISSSTPKVFGNRRPFSGFSNTSRRR